MGLYLLLLFAAFSQPVTETVLEQKILTIEKEIADIHVKISTNNQAILLTEQQMTELEMNIGQRKRYLAKRLLAQKHVKDMSWIFSLDAKNKSILDRNLKIFKRINYADVTAIHEYQLAFEELEDQKKHLVSENQKLAVLTQQLQEQEEKLKSVEREQIIKLTQIRDIDHLLNFKGTLSLPIKAPIISHFGSSQDRDNQYVLLVKGLVMDGQSKQTVSAFGPGKVIFNDLIPYWGNSLIISHKGGYFSVYAGVENILVNVNDMVKKEQIIAKTTGQNFYFELRHQSIPLNPLSWIRKEND